MPSAAIEAAVETAPTITRSLPTQALDVKIIFMRRESAKADFLFLLLAISIAGQRYTGSIHSAESNFGLLTLRETSTAFIFEAG